MKNVKRTLALVLALALVLSLAACGEKNTETQAETKAGSKEETLPESSKEESKPESAPAESKEETETAGSEAEPTDLDKLKVEIKESFDGKAAGYTFRVGVGREVITPSVGTPLAGYSNKRISTTVNDDLHIICHAFEQEGKILLSFSMDVCSCGGADMGIVLMTAMETGVPKENIHVATTHDHSGPSTEDSTYNKTILIPAAARAAKTALENLQWAEMGVATIQSQVGINRRQYSTKSRSVILGQDPNGPYDPTMTVISFRDHEGKCISNIIHYGAHNTASGQNTEITRDWCGVMKDAVEALSGGVTAFYNGAQGDVGPRLASGKTTGTLKEALAHGEIAAKDAVACWKTITEWKKDCRLTDVHGTIYIPYAKLDAAKIQEQIDDLMDKGSLSSYEEVQLTGLRAGLSIAQGGRTDFKDYEVKVHYFALGDVVFVPTPFENFAEMILQIRAGSPYPYTLVVSNSDGHEGYFLTKDEIPRGGYESQYYWRRTTQKTTPWFAEDGTVYYADQAIDFLKQMQGK